VKEKGHATPIESTQERGFRAIARRKGNIELEETGKRHGNRKHILFNFNASYRNNTFYFNASYRNDNIKGR